MCPTVLLAVVEVGGGTEFLPAVSFSEFGLVNSSSELDSILLERIKFVGAASSSCP